jgi:hypothetical protein
VGARFRASVSALALTVVAAAAVAQPAAAAKTPAACRAASLFGRNSEQPAAELPGTLEAGVLSSFSVFARPQSASDELPPVNTAGLSLELRMSSYYPGEIRQLFALPNGRRFLAIPGFLRTFKVPPAICLPKALRKHRAQLVEEEVRLRTAPAYCIVELGARRIFGGGECTPFSDAARSEGVFEAGPAGSEAVVEMVPNGISAVRVVYPHGPPVLAAVHENAYLLNVPQAILRELRKLEHQVNDVHFPKHPTKAQQRTLNRALSKLFHRIASQTEPVRVEWLAADGKAVKVTPRPRGVGDGSVLGILSI